MRQAGKAGAQLFQHVLRQLDQLGALLDQRVAAARLRRMNGAGNRKDFLALLGRQPRGDERARLQRRLNHQRAPAQTGNDAVALGKVGRQRRRAQGKLADEQALQGNAVRQLQVFFGVDPVQSGADHRNRRAAAQQRAIVRRAVDAQRQTRHHANTRAAKRLGKLPGIALALRGGIAAAHDGQALCYGFAS